MALPRTARVTINAATVSMAKAIRVTARSGPLLILTAVRSTTSLTSWGGMDAACRFILTMATNADRPIEVSGEIATGSRSAFAAPKAWTTERLKGWVAGHHEAIEAMFETAMPVLPEAP